MSVRWTGQQQVLSQMQAYVRRVNFAVQQVARYFAAVFERYAKENAPWTDRTANARQSLYSWTENLANDVVRLWLSHGVEYGVYLEVANGGKYAIVWPTIDAHLDEIRRMLQEIFR